jgi:predicted porin
MAQVTVSGFINGSYDTFSISSKNSTRVGATSENRVTDNSSRIIFSANEDLGGGMRAIAQFDLRFSIDQMSPIGPTDGTETTGNPVSGGNSHIGIAAPWGTVRLGRQDVQYVEGANFNPAGTATIASHAGLLHSSGASTMGWASRTPNLIWYVSPRVSGIQATVGYSTNPSSASSNIVQVENDLGKTGTGSRKGSGTLLKLDASLGQLALVYSQIDNKTDYTGLAQGSGGVTGAGGTYTGKAQPDQNGKILTAKYDIGGGLKVGVGHAQNESSVVLTGVATKRSVSQVGVGYAFGSNELAFTYTDASDRKAGGVKAVETGANAMSLVFAHNLSKRTQLAASYQVLENDRNANDGLFYNGATVMSNVATLNGEKHSAISLGVRHSF